MDQNSTVWKGLEEIFERGAYSKVGPFLKDRDRASLNLYNFAHLCKTFAGLHKSNAYTGSDKKVAGYALAAGLCFIDTLQRAEAKETLKWMKENTDEVGAIYLLEDELEAHFPKSGFGGKAFVTNPTIQNGFNDVTPEADNSFSVIPSSLLSALSPQEFIALMKKAKEKSFDAGKVLFREGDASNAFYVVVEGDLELSASSGLKKTFSTGDFFGEIAVISGKRRTGTITTKSPTKLLEFSKKAFDETLKNYPGLEKRVYDFYRLRLFLSTAARMKIFKGADNKILEEAFKLFEGFDVTEGKTIDKDHLYSSKVFFLVRGEMEETNAGIALHSFGAGEFFGEEKVNSDYLAKSDCELLRCSAENFDQILFLIRKG